MKKRTLGNKLNAQYKKWASTLSLEDFIDFIKIIKENKDKIGVAQFFGKFRAYAFEEYIYQLLNAKIVFPSSLQLFWGEKCLVWKKERKEYAMEFDISIGRKVKCYVEPVVVFDAKVELDSSRLKTALASFAILKTWNPKTRCVLLYMNKELDDTLLEIAGHWVDGIFQFNLTNDECKAFLEYITECLE
jgi:hypothetical protein